MQKHIILLCLFLISLNFSAQETKLNYGVKAGLNYSKLTPNINFNEFDTLEYNGKIGFYFGGFINYELLNFLKIQPEILFGSQGTNTLRKTMVVPQLILEAKTRITESNILIPVLLQLYPFKGFYLEFGPQIGFVVSRQEKVTEETWTEFTGTFELEDNCPYCHDFNSGFIIGAGIAVSDMVEINLRYFTEFNSKDETIKFMVFNLGCSYKF